MSHANESNARAYLLELTGFVPGRVVSNFPHRIEFSYPDGAVPADAVKHMARYVPTSAVETDDSGAITATMGYGKVLFLGKQSFGLRQVCAPSENLVQQIYGAWQAIAEEGLDVKTNEEALELCLDADRMSLYGGEAGKKADDEVTALTNLFGYAKVEEALCKKVNLV